MQFIKNADLYLDDFGYMEMEVIKLEKKTEEGSEEKVLNLHEKKFRKEQIWFVHKDEDGAFTSIH